MTTRRQQRIARIVKEVVSDAINNRLNDPRLEGFVSITRVEITGRLRAADVYLTILAENDAVKNKTFAAIIHAKSKLQSLLAENLQIRFCPVLNFYKDEKLKKTLKVMKIIDDLAKQHNHNGLEELKED